MRKKAQLPSENDSCAFLIGGFLICDDVVLTYLHKILCPLY